MSVEGTAVVSARVLGPREGIEGHLRAFLEAEREQVAAIDPEALPVFDEITRLVAAGGKRLRPAFCYWGYRAVGGSPGPPIERASAALELLHTMALIHDDLMDGAAERRGVPSTSALLGTSVAVLAGDLAAVLADRLLLDSGFDAAALVRGLEPYHRMRVGMALGQYLDVAVPSAGSGRAREVAWLKGGSYTVEGPLQVGAALAGAGNAPRATLRDFGRPLGEAFQLRDDLVDGDAADGIDAAAVNDLVHAARTALTSASDPLDPEAVAALDELASLVAIA
jgi:geranylgeranyl diphosphate synthase, type I